MLAILGVSLTLASTGALSSLLAACNTTAADEGPAIGELSDAAHRDGSPVDPGDGGVADGGSPDAPTCNDYCAAVMSSCTGDDAQYASPEECLSFCALLPLGMTGESKGDSIACRQFYAGSAAKTDSTYCAAAGPFGGGTCGDRCPIFCELTQSACLGGGESGAPQPYASYSDCQTACVSYGYVDGGLDGGGESTTGPDSGNTLNCRLFYLREAVSMGAMGCENLGVDSPACK